MKKQDLLNIQQIGVRKYGTPKAASLLAKHKDADFLGFEQPLPDIIGFQQHGGECASDSLQEILLFADGIREYTQPIIYGMTPEQIEVRTRINLDFEDWNKFEGYFHYIQKRFRAHYDAINYMRIHKISAQKYYSEHDTVCLIDPLFKKKERISLEAGVLALKRLKGEFQYTGTGMQHKQVKKAITGILACTGVPYEHVEGVRLDAVGIIIIAYSDKIRAEGRIKSSMGHSVGFLKVFDKWVYYDDNLGFIKIDEHVIKALKEERLQIVNYREVYFMRIDDSGTPESVWIDGVWSKDGLKSLVTSDGKFHIGIYIYLPHSYSSVVPLPKTPLINDSHTVCGITQGDLNPKNVAALSNTIEKFRNCIYQNINSNAEIFENLYHFLYDNIELVKADPDALTFLTNTSATVVMRVGCRPMTLYWCSLIKRELEGKKQDNFSWYDIAKIDLFHNPRGMAHTPPKFKEALEMNRKKRADTESPKLEPCLPGQYRNAKTLKCHDRKARTKKSVHSSNRKIPKEPKERRTKCPKGETRDPKTGECMPRLGPCPPGEVRDKETKECKPRMEKGRCPEGQIRDPKTKKCRDQKKYKF